MGRFNHVLGIDIETYSDVPISYGVHRYIDTPAFEINIFGCSLDGGPVMVFDLSQRQLPRDIKDIVLDKDTLKTAFNAKFEMLCLRRFYDIPIDPKTWEDTQALVAYNSLPLSLDQSTKVLHFTDALKKDSRGKALITYFAKPCKPTKSNGWRTRNLPQHAPDKWATYLDYNKQDVIAEQALRDKLSFLAPPQFEHDIWCMDWDINDRGIGRNSVLVKNCITYGTMINDQLLGEMRAISGIDNPKSISQLKAYIADRIPGYAGALDKAAVTGLLNDPNTPPDARRVLEIRRLTGRSSLSKYDAIDNTVTAEGRCHDLFQYYGANRTGRWAGRNIQLQNLPRNSLDNLDQVRQDILTKDYTYLIQHYDNLPDTMSQLIRTAFEARPGHRYIVADFSAIEARVIAWLAGETWRQEVFRTTGKIYEASASQMFHVPADTIVHGHKNYELRQKGKVAELALGYGGGSNALISMGALTKGLTEDELPEIVAKWRAASPRITKFWRDCDTAARAVVQGRRECVKLPSCDISMHCKANTLMIELPSKRHLVYIAPRVGPGKFGGDALSYMGLRDKQGKGGGNHWSRIETWGGKLTENIVQAVARDCLAVAMMRLEIAGYKIVMHVHDEAIAEMPDGVGSLDEMIAIMTKNAPWNHGLIMNAAGFENKYYMKD